MRSSEVDLALLGQTIPQDVATVGQRKPLKGCIRFLASHRVAEVLIESVHIHRVGGISLEWIGDRRAVAQEAPIEGQHSVWGDRTNGHAQGPDPFADESLHDEASDGVPDEDGIRVLDELSSQIIDDGRQPELSEPPRDVPAQFRGLAIMQRPGER